MRESIVKLSAVLLALSVIITSVTFAPRGSIVTALDNTIIENTSIDRESILATVGYLLCLCDEEGCIPEEPNENCPNCSQGKECRYGAEPKCVCEEECDPESDEENECPHCSIEGNECQFEDDDTPDEDDDTTTDGDDDSLDEDDDTTDGDDDTTDGDDDTTDGDDDTPDEGDDEDEDELPPLELTSQFEYNGKTYADGDTIEIAHEEKITLNVSIPVENEGGVFAIDIPKGLELTSVAYTPASVTAVASTFVVKTTLSNSYNVVAGEENTFAITVGIDPFLMSYADEVEVGSIELVYTDSTGVEVATTSIGVDLTSYIASQTPTVMTTPILSVSTSYANTWYEDDTGKIVLTDTNYIRVKASVSDKNTGGTLEFDIPKGMELVSAPGVSGLSEISPNSTEGTKLIERAFLLTESTYLNTVSWSPDLEVPYYNTIYRKNGVLSYGVNNGSIDDVSIYVKIDTNFISYYYTGKYDNATLSDDIITQLLGQIKVTYSTSNETVSTPDIYIKNEQFNLTFSSLSAIESLDTFYNTTTTADSKLTYGLSDTVNVSTSVSIDNTFVGTRSIFITRDLVITVIVPTGAKITKNLGTLELKSTGDQPYKNFTQPASGNGLNDTALYDTYTITIASPSFSLTSGKYTCTLNNFLTVKFPSDTFKLGDDGASVNHYIYVDNFTMDLVEYYYGDGTYNGDVNDDKSPVHLDNKFVWISQIVDVDNLTDDMDVRRTTVTIEDLESDNDSYVIRWDSYQGNNEVHNPEDSKDQLLYKARRYFRDGYLSSIALPITIEYYQDKVETDGNDATYLDQVNKLVMATPLLGDIDRYGAKISKIYVAFADGTSETIDSFNGWIGDNSTGYHPVLNYSSSSGTFSSDNFTATYVCNTIANSNPIPSNITITALNGKNIVNAILYFYGDNETYTDGFNYVYGTPISDDSTTEFSSHWFNVNAYAIDDRAFEHATTGDSDSIKYGFKWQERINFELTRTALWSTDISTKYSPFNYFTFNTAIYNMKLQIANWSHNPRGYLDMGIIRYNNYSGSDADSVVLEIVPNGYADLHLGDYKDQVDVIKEIMFPYNNSSNLTQIVSVEYKYNEDSTVYVYNRDFHGTSNVPFTVEQRSVSGETSVYYAQKSAFMTAPADKSFEYITVTYDSWGVTNENRYVMFKGYPDPVSVTSGTNGTATIHTVNVSYNGKSTTNTQKEDRTGRKMIDISSGGSGIGVDVLNTTTGALPGSGSSDLVEYNTLVKGRTNTLQYKVYAGTSVYISSSQGYRGIAFDIILPDGITLEHASVSDTLSTMYSYSNYNALFTPEKVGGITITNDGNPVQTINNHFGADLHGYRYRLELNDEYTRLYGFYSLKWITGLLQTCITLDLEVFVDDVKISEIPYNKVFFAGSTAHKVSATSAGYSTGDGVTAGTSVGHGFGSNNAVTIGNGSNYFLYVDTFPFVSVHSAHITLEDDSYAKQYYYSEGNTDTIAVLDDVGENAKINFSITNAVYFDDTDTDQDGTKTAYVYFPLPINTELDKKSDLVSQQDFYVTLNDNPITMSYKGSTFTLSAKEVKAIGDGGGTVEWRYRELPKQTNIINMDEAEKDWKQASEDSVANASAIIVKLVDFPADTLDVSISVKGPTLVDGDIVGLLGEGTDITDTDIDNDGNEVTQSIGKVYGIGLSGISIFNTSSAGNTGIYFGGDGPDPSLMSVNPGYIGNNPVYFEFAYKKWDIDYKAMLYYTTLDGGTVVVEFPQADYSDAQPDWQYNKQSITLPAGDKKVDGYEFVAWYWDYDLTHEVSGNPIITEDTTFYAEYKPIMYTVEYENQYISNMADRTVSWDRTDLDSEESTLVDGRIFVGWSTQSNNPDKIIDKTISYADIAGQDSVKSIKLYAIYEDTLYTVYYDIAGSIPKENVSWYDTNLLPDSFTSTVIGKTFLGWGISADYIIDDSYMFGDVYNKFYELTGIDQQYIELIPYYEETKYTVQFNANGNSITTPSSLSVYWLTRVLDQVTIAPKLEGKDFVGWSTSSTDLSQCIDSFTTYSEISSMVLQSDSETTPITLYAHFVDREYTVIYDFNASTYAYAPEPQTKPTKVKWGESIWDTTQFYYYDYDYGDTDSSIASGTFHIIVDDPAHSEFRIMYRFEGWYADEEYTIPVSDIRNVMYKELAVDDDQDTLILYAKYSIVHYAIKYRIDENIGGLATNEKLADADYKYLTDNVSFYERGRQEPDTVLIPQNVAGVTFIEKGDQFYYYDYGVYKFNVPGYVWNDWKAVLDDEDDAKNKGNTISDSFVLKTESKYYEPFGYIDSDYEQAVTEDKLAESIIINGQFTPKYYYVSYLVESGLINESSPLAGSSDKYTEIHQNVVTWQGGDLASEVESSGVTIDVRDGYKFAGWYDTPNPQEGDEPITDMSVLADFFFNNDVTKIDDEGELSDKDTITGDAKLTLYAVYTPLEYEVRYDLGYQAIDDDPNKAITLNYLLIGDELVLPEITREGYTFNGWYVELDHETLIPLNNKGESWTFETYYKETLPILYPDNDYSDGIIIDENSKITIYASWSLDISLGISDQVIMIEASANVTTGETKCYYNITNYSHGNIIGLQYVSTADTEWIFSTVELDLTQTETQTVTVENSIDAYVEEFAKNIGVTEEEALSIIEEFGLMEDIIETIQLSEEKSKMYVHLTGYQYPQGGEIPEEPFYNETLQGNTEQKAIINNNNTTLAEVTFQYELNREYEEGDIIDLFHIDYKFGLN